MRRPLFLLFAAVSAALLLAFVLWTAPSGSSDPALPEVQAASPGGADSETQPAIALAGAGAEAAAEEPKSWRESLAPTAHAKVDFGTGQMVGLVVDFEGTPIAEAEVRLVLAEVGEDAPTLETVTTDYHGGFYLTGLSREVEYVLIASHPDFAAERYAMAPIPEGRLMQQLLQLSPPFRLRGRVLDPQGEPVAGARILMEDPMADRRALTRSLRQTRERVAVSDEEGRYAFEDVGNGIRRLEVTHADFATLIVQYVDFLDRDDANQERDLSMELGHLIAGRVVDAHGNGVPGAEVLATSYQKDRLGGGSAISAEDGSFTVEGLIEGEYLLRTTILGNRAEPMLGVMAGTTDLVIPADERGTLVGEVVTPSGQPVSEFLIQVRRIHPQNRAYGQPIAFKAFSESRDGRFALRGVPPGEYVLQATAEGYASVLSKKVEVLAGVESANVRMPLDSGGVLQGRVVDARGEPIADARVETVENHWLDDRPFEHLMGFASATTKSNTQTDSEGRFVLDRLSPADYQVRITHDRYVRTVENDVQVRTGRATEMGELAMIPGGTVFGRVLDASGQPANGIGITLTLEGGGEEEQEAYTDGEGRFRVEVCAPGTYVLGARPAGDTLDLPCARLTITVVNEGEHEHELHLCGT